MTVREFLYATLGAVLGAGILGGLMLVLLAPPRMSGKAGGHPYRGVVLSIRPIQPSDAYYSTGADILVAAKNIGTQPVAFWRDGGEVRFALFTANGEAVPMTSDGEAVAAGFGFFREARGRTLRTLTPGEDAVLSTHRLRHWFHVPHGGRYYLVAMQEVQRGFAVSNMLTIDL